jgi:hypothetical protein
VNQGILFRRVGVESGDHAPGELLILAHQQGKSGPTETQVDFQKSRLIPPEYRTAEPLLLLKIA